MPDFLHFKKIDEDFMGCYFILDGKEILIATILGASTLNIPIREKFIALCKDIINDMAKETGKPKYRWSKTEYVGKKDS